jgi:hypothetical protein
LKGQREEEQKEEKEDRKSKIEMSGSWYEQGLDGRESCEAVTRERKEEMSERVRERERERNEKEGTPIEILNKGAGFLLFCDRLALSIARMLLCVLRLYGVV